MPIRTVPPITRLDSCRDSCSLKSPGVEAPVAENDAPFRDLSLIHIFRERSKGGLIGLYRKTYT